LLKDRAIQKRIVGRAGEFLTAYHLELLGVSPRIVGGEDFDIVAIRGNRLLRIQVKTRDKTEKIRNTYSFPLSKNKMRLSKDNADIFAFVCLPVEKILFYTPEIIQKSQTLRLQPEDFFKMTIEESWKNCLGRILNGLE
tara:strand:- start:864 stop:1280 length:417 start_codon:yes stop_codon:yes gene_type:complete